LIWYETGSWVVAVNPPGYAKLAFDPAVFTGHAQAARRLDVSRAFNGDGAALASVADAYDANEILLARRGDRWGLIDQVASVSVRQPSAVGTAAIVHGNGWDAVDLSPGERLATSIRTSAQAIDLEIRFVGERRAGPDRRVDLLGDGENGERLLARLAVPATGGGDWVVVSATVQPKADERVSIVAVDPVVVQSLRGFVASSPPAGWHLATMTEDAILLRRTE
jgi:hypothetical protein